ncbi:hypothetical protein Q4579_13770 [Photobacterium sp. 1_MG-2023]|nr:hypothetical protein [Photobacterium sp. 1_MG-2023]
MTQQAMQLQIVSLRSGMESHPESYLDVSLQAATMLRFTADGLMDAESVGKARHCLSGLCI